MFQPYELMNYVFTRKFCIITTDTRNLVDLRTRAILKPSVESRICVRFAFALLRTAFVCQNVVPLSQPLQESQIKTNLETLTLFSRARCRLHVLDSSSDWFIKLFATVVIGQ